MFICVWVAFDPEDPDYTHDIGMLRLLRIMEPKDDLYDELIIDGVIGLASFWADGAEFCLVRLKESHYFALCGRQRANSGSNIHQGEHTHNYLRLNGADFAPHYPPPHPKKSAKCSRLELTTVTGGHLGGVGQHGPLIRPLQKDGAGNDVHFALSTEQQGYD